MFITELSVEKTQALRNHTSFTFWWQRERYGSRKGTIQKCFTNPKKYSESISFRQIAFEKFVKSTKTNSNPWLSTHLLSFKTLDLADLYFFNRLERLDISGSNSTPILFLFLKKKALSRAFEHNFGPGGWNLNNWFWRVKFPRGREVEVSNWSMHKHDTCLSTYSSLQ